MNLPPLLIQTAGSLAAILLLAGLARLLRLGGAPVLADEATVQRAAGEVVDGFVVTDFAVTRDGTAALARDEDGRILVIRRHGNRFAGRVLDASATVRVSDGTLTIDCGERRFGCVNLELADSIAWADAINALKAACDA